MSSSLEGTPHYQCGEDVIKKQHKTPVRELQVARKRLSEVKQWRKN